MSVGGRPVIRRDAAATRWGVAKVKVGGLSIHWLCGNYYTANSVGKQAVKVAVTRRQNRMKTIEAVLRLLKVCDTAASG